MRPACSTRGKRQNFVFAAELAAIDARVGALKPGARRRRPEPGRRTRLRLFMSWSGTRAPAFGSGGAWPRAPATLPPLLAAALALDAWTTIEPLQHRPWLGALAVSGLLGARGKARHHLPCLVLALRLVPRERRRAQDPPTRLVPRFWRPSRLGPGRGSRTTTAGSLPAVCSNQVSGRRNTRSCRR